jgi:uncharacterized protein (TIGR02246 family)
VATIGALYANDAVWVLPGSLAMGRDAIQKHLEGDFKAGLHDIKIHEIEEHVVGNAAWLVSEWDLHTPGQNGVDAPVRGFASIVLVHQGDSWKIQEHTTNIANSPAGQSNGRTP